jgi:hypothetical protein
LYVGTETGKILKYIENSQLQLDLLNSFESFKKKPILKISVDEKFKILFFKDEDNVGILNSFNLTLKEEFSDENNQKGYFTPEFTLFHQDSVTRNEKQESNNFIIFQSKKKEICVYNYTSSEFKLVSKVPVSFPVKYFFSIGDIMLTYFKKIQVYNIGKNSGKIDSDNVFEPPSKDFLPSISYVTNRNWKLDSFIAYSFCDEYADPVYLEDKSKKIPNYLANDGMNLQGRFCDLKFSSFVERSEISFPLVAAIVKQNDKYNLEFKNVFNERTTSKDKHLRDKLVSTKDPFPIEIESTSLPQLSSNYLAFYISDDYNVYKVKTPSVNDFSLMLQKDGLVAASQKLLEIKTKKEYFNDGILQNTFVTIHYNARFKNDSIYTEFNGWIFFFVAKVFNFEKRLKIFKCH